jgi:hypothetical protein
MERSGDEGRQHDQSESIVVSQTTTNENSETDTNLPVGGGSERHEQNGSDVAENGMLINFEKLTFGLK